MTGFLQRLAERATGVRQPLRAAAPSLFAPPLIEEVPAVVDAPGIAPANAAPSSMPPVTIKRAQPGQADDRMHSAKPVQHRELEHRHSERTGEPVMARRRRDSAEPEDEAVVHPPTSETPPTLMPRMDDAKSSHAGQAAPSQETPHQQHQDADPALPRPASDVIPEPLLPRVSPARVLPGVASAPGIGNQGRVPAGMVEETTEVHVSIGRIEVTAVHEPALPKPAAARRQTPMSLDEYLAKRHGGRT